MTCFTVSAQHPMFPLQADSGLEQEPVTRHLGPRTASARRKKKKIKS